MKKLMAFVILLWAASTAPALSLNEAEKLYQDGDFASALPKYQQIIQTAQADTLYQAQLRAAACAYSQGEYLHAAKMMVSYPLPANPLWQARFYLYRIQMAQQASTQYRRILETRELENNADMEHWTRTQWDRQIQQDFEHLWALRHHLINAPIEQETLILNLQDTDTRRIATLFDFATRQWVDFLTRSEISFPPAQARTYLNGLATPFAPQQERANTIADILHTAYTLEGIGRQNARLFWQTEYILLPFEHPAYFELKKPQQAAQTAAAQLTTLAFTTPVRNWWGKIKQYLAATQAPAATDYGKSYAAYQAAQLLFQQEDRSQALQICNQATQFLESSYYTQQCQELANQITAKEVSFQALTGALTPEKPQLKIKTRNVPTVYVRIYPVTVTELENWAKARNYKHLLTAWNELTQLGQQNMTALLTSGRDYQPTQVNPVYQKPYTHQDTTLTLPSLSHGFYAVLASYDKDFSPVQAPVTGVLINVTDLALFTTAAIQDNPDLYTWTLQSSPHTYQPPVFHFYTFNLKTGQPEPGATLQLLTDRQAPPQTLISNEQGMAALSRAITVDGKKSTSWNVNARAEKNGNVALSPRNTYFYWHPDEPVRLFAQTDRAIYRPGQTVQMAVQGFEKTVRGWNVWPGQKVQLTVYGANGKQVYQSTLSLNNFGTAKTSFPLPEKDLVLGHFSVRMTAQANTRTYTTDHSFAVEAYKRPEYEITLQNPEEVLAYHRKGTIRGQARYYTGTPLQHATVKYTVTRREYVPLFYWWHAVSSTPEEIAQGQTRTDGEGEFTLSFTPQPTRKDEQFAQYTVRAEVFDETGRAIETTRTYQVSTRPHLFNVDFTQGFYDANKATPLAEITLTDADAHATTGTVTAHIYRVEDTPDTTQHALDGWYQKAKIVKTYPSQTLLFKTPGAQTLHLPALPEGIYRLTLQEAQAEEQSLIFVVAAPQSTLHLPAVTLVQQKNYYPGQTARILLGAGSLQGTKQAEIYYRTHFLRRSEQLPGGVSIYEYPVTEADRGGLAIRWFGVYDYAFYQSSSSFEVPFDNQELAIHTDIASVVKPGQPVKWHLTAHHKTGTPLTGQANITVYDKSLDYYAQQHVPFTLSSLFAQATACPGMIASTLSGYAALLYKGQNAHTWTPAPQLPRLNLVMQRVYYNGLHRGAMPLMAMAKSTGVMAANELAVAEESMDTKAWDDAAPDTATRSVTPHTQEEPTGANIRTDFAETAYFNPLLPLKNGQATAQFTLPQSITTWNILGYVLTKNAQLGTFHATTVARKDFMLRLHLPRFYREQDSGVLQASVMNLTDKKITVPVTLSIKQETTDKLADFGVKQPVQTLTLPANSTSFATWHITAPSAPGIYQITAVARHGQESDGEQKELPVLPGRVRLLASAHTALQNGENTLTVTELDGITDAQPQLAALTLHPSLALSVLHKMPNLLTNPYHDLISSLNRYVPLAIVHRFYTTYPALQDAVKKLPHRPTVTAPWNETNPVRMTLLEQTPWWSLAQGNPQRNASIISLFDANTVSAQLSRQRAKVLTFQRADGAFSWFAGGPADTYLTLRALEAFAQAAQFGADVPQQETEKALAYIVPHIEQNLKQDKSGSASTVSFALYAAYVVSSFPAHWIQTAAAKAYVKKWVDYASTQDKFMTPLGQTYAAAIYHRLGDDVKANRYLDKVLARLKYNPLTGAYFAPEAQSWLWYQDTLTTQTATLKTLLEIRPGSDKIDPLVQWLLFNKQVTSWKDPSSAAKAVFVLLDVMKTKGALSSKSTYRINWAGMTEERLFEPFDWTDDLQWVKQEDALSPAVYTATVHKQSKMTDFASLNVIYTSAQAKKSPQGVLNVQREYFVRFTQEGVQKLRPVKEAQDIQKADEVEVHLTLTADSAFEYVLLTDPKPAGFESAELTSGWTWDPVSLYREVRDADTHFFIYRLPAGKMTLRYVLRPTVPGTFHVQPAQVQSMYAPEYAAHSAAEKLTVRN